MARKAGELLGMGNLADAGALMGTTYHAVDVSQAAQFAGPIHVT